MEERKKIISIGSDHAGFPMKKRIVEMLQRENFEVIDRGTNSEDSVDYPDFIHPVAHDIECGTVERAIILCGSGNGAAITANKHQSIRAAVCWSVEQASLARQHNNANICSIPGRFVEEATAFAIVNTFLNTDFEGGRHERRINKIPLSKEYDEQDC